jgi:type 2 lantibiotic biosynthesis protein LanM
MKSAIETSVREGQSLSAEDLASIVERGCGIYERLSADYETVEGPAADRARQDRLEEWKNVVAAGDEERFQRRIAWDELSPANLNRMLGPVRLRDRDALPAWARLLGEITREVCRTQWNTSLRGCCREEEPIQFEHLLSPLVGAASHRLLARCESGARLLRPTALDGLERALLRRLAMFLSETLFLEFEIFRSRRASGLELMLRRSRDDQSDEIYRSFIEHMFGGGLRELWLEYPAMARLVAVALESWIDASADLLERLRADATTLGDWVSPGKPLEVAAVEGLLSDSHHRGRWVSILTFSSGIRVVYKPRPVANEAEWFRLLDWLNRHGSPENMRSVGVIERAGYGWMEVIQAEPLPDAEAATRYFRRCGMLLALTYAVGTNDLHFENLIAVGEQPILIDLETILCHSPVETTYGISTDDLLRTVFFESPLRTGLLPRWQLGQGAAVDVSGLGAVAGQRSRVPVPRWKNLNRDLMDLAYETVEGKPGMNAAMLEGRPLSPNDYLKEITEGFSEMYRLLLSLRSEMTRPGGPIAALEALKVRFIFRPTAFYLLTVKGSRLPHLLRDGADRSIHLEPIAAPFLLARKKPTAWPLLEIERESMEIEDCPHFSAPVNSNTIDSPDGGALEGILEASCYQQMVARFERLSEEDLENHLGLIHASFDSRSDSPAHGAAPANRIVEPPLPPAAPLSNTELLEEATRLADELLARSVSGGTHAPNWVTLRRLETIGKTQLDPIGSDLFEGRAGVALMLASLSRVSGIEKYGDAARQIARVLSDALGTIDPRYLPPEMLIHGLTGIASLAYVFPHLRDLLGEPAFGETAVRAVRFLSGQNIAADRRYDVLSGAAGSLLCALRAASDEAIQTAVACGEHLLASRTADEGGRSCWTTFEDRPISGFSHGNSGIAYALYRLAAICGDSRFRDAAAEALSFEDGTFSENEGNWPDLRWEQISYAAGWCHGAPGMALPRAQANGRHLETAVATTLANVGGGPDHLCCGNFGRVLVLEAIGREKSRPEWSEEAQKLAAALVHRARSARGFRLMRQYTGYVSFPGLFQGTSGIAYALLKLASPHEVPDLIELK